MQPAITGEQHVNQINDAVLVMVVTSRQPSTGISGPRLLMLSWRHLVEEYQMRAQLQ